MVSKELFSLLKADTRTSDEMSRASGIHPVTIRKLRTGVKSLGSASLETSLKLAAAFGFELVLKKTRK